jgi:hypothetical protein
MATTAEDPLRSSARARRRRRAIVGGAVGEPERIRREIDQLEAQAGAAARGSG